MKIFQVSSEGEREWVLHHSPEEALQYLANLNNVWVEDYATAGVEVIPPDKWKDYHVVDPDSMEPDDTDDYDQDLYASGFKIIESFAEFAARHTEPSFIASTVDL